MIHNIFVQETLANILIYLRNKGKQAVRDIAYDLCYCYGNVQTDLITFEEMGIVVLTTESRLRTAELTEKGSRMADILQHFIDVSFMDVSEE